MSAATLEAFLATAKPLSSQSAQWTEADGALPALYLGHGAPPLLDDEFWMHQLATWARSMPKPTAILIVSAHWENAPLAIGATAANTPLVYDFGGFDERFYRLTYPTPDSTELAQSVARLLPDGQQLHQSAKRGLDHGAWVPLMVMYPNGDVPVLQMSLPTSDPEQLIEIGRSLAPLRESGVLIIGSGFLTHGLPYLSPANWAGNNNPPGWSTDFDAWANEAIARADLDELSAYADRAPGMPYAHPTVEHLSPLFVTLGAATDLSVPATNVIDGWFMGLSKRSIQVA
jgi:4,5-DOPA dioxygenase extradiol